MFILTYMLRTFGTQNFCEFMMNTVLPTFETRRPVSLEVITTTLQWLLSTLSRSKVFNITTVNRSSLFTSVKHYASFIFRFRSLASYV